MIRAAGAGALVVLLGGCFVDAVGLGPGAGGSGEGGATPTSVTTGNDAGPTTTAATTSSTTQSTTTGGMGGEGGMGGGPCADSVLVLDDSDFARVTSDDFDMDDDFAAGAWIYATPDPTFVPGDGIVAISGILSHGDLAGEDGFVLGLQETADNGMPYAGFVAYPFGDPCLALAPIAWNQWVHVAGVYNDDIGGDDLFIYVNGALVDGVNCGAPPPVSGYSGPLVIGGLADSTAGFVGSVDDVFVKHGSSLPNIGVPLNCDAGYVAAFNFENGMASSCADALVLVPDAAPGDPEIDCMQ